ncbi:hypothetical protein N7486_006764 [Penicillium sp. IBT 16267x]|nr:hypothetical protein N7486_006764 [Penicillium sp. IBT 16267x]
MASQTSTLMDKDDTNPQDLQLGAGPSVTPTEAGSTSTAPQSLEVNMELLRSAMQSMQLPRPGQEQHQIWDPFTESLKSSITYAQGEIDKLDDEMLKLISEMGKYKALSKEAFDLVDQMLCSRQEVWNLDDQSWELGERFVKLQQRINNRQNQNAYLSGLAVSCEGDEELKEEIWELKFLVEGHVNMLEITRKRQVELFTQGSMFQSQLDRV